MQKYLDSILSSSSPPLHNLIKQKDTFKITNQ